MDKPAERKPVDEFFARKLENMSLPPSADGFSRLQARLQHQQQPSVVFWRNPTVHRYIAAAACLLLVALFGWLYQSATNTGGKESQVADSKPAIRSNKPAEQQQPSSPVVSDDEAIAQTPESDAVPTVSNGRDYVKRADVADRMPAASPARKPVPNKNGVQVEEQVTVAQHQPTVTNGPEKTEAPANPAANQLADNKATTPAPAERVLVVTISEPETLVAAREKAQSAIDNKSAVANADKSTDEHQSGKLWQQVRRIKSGEVFARSDKNEDEHGLLNRAYSGLKRSIDKEKSSRQ